MQTHPIMGDLGTMFAVEVENAYIRPRRLAELLRGVAGVSSVHLRRPFRGVGDVHVTFEYRCRPFIVLEPFGDNSRYWIGPDDATAEKVDVSAIDAALRQFRPSTVARLIGGLLTLRFTSSE